VALCLGGQCCKWLCMEGKTRQQLQRPNQQETLGTKHRLRTRRCNPNLLVSSSQRLDTYKLHEAVSASQLMMVMVALWECWLCCNSSNVDTHGTKESNVCAFSAMPEMNCLMCCTPNIAIARQKISTFTQWHESQLHLLSLLLRDKHHCVCRTYIVMLILTVTVDQVPN